MKTKLFFLLLMPFLSLSQSANTVLWNYQFESGYTNLSGWDECINTSWSEEANTSMLSIVGGGAYEGSNYCTKVDYKPSFKINTETGQPTNEICNYNGFSSYDDYSIIEINYTYKFSFWVKAEHSGTIQHAKVLYLESLCKGNCLKRESITVFNRIGTETGIKLENVPVTTEWTYYEIEHTITFDDIYAKSQGTKVPFFEITFNDTESNVFYFDDIKLIGPNLLGIEEFNQNVFSVSPNPVKDILNINLNSAQTLKQVNIYNIQSQYLYSEKDTKIDVSNLASGMYFIEVETNKGKSAKKIVVE